MNMFSLIPTTTELELGECSGCLGCRGCEGCDGCDGCDGTQVKIPDQTKE